MNFFKKNNENYIVNNNDSNNNEINDEKNKQYKEILAHVSSAFLEYRLKKLQASSIDSEKDVLTRISDDMEREKNLSRKQKEAFDDAIDNAYDVDCFLTSLQWFAAKCCVLFSFGIILKCCDTVRNRWDNGVKNARVFERLQESKDDLLQPLKMLKNINAKNITIPNLKSAEINNRE